MTLSAAEVLQLLRCCWVVQQGVCPFECKYVQSRLCGMLVCLIGKNFRSALQDTGRLAMQ